MTECERPLSNACVGPDCHRRGVHAHHAVYRQHLPAGTLRDPRNLVRVCFECHGAHHGRSRVLPLRVLPDPVFAFAADALGPSAAYSYLARYYTGPDPRLDALLDIAA